MPGLVDDAGGTLDDVQRFFDDKGVNVKIKGEGESALSSLQDQIVKGSGEIVSLTGELLRLLIELSFYVILVVVLSIYMLIYAPRIGELVRSIMPPGDGTPEDDYPTRGPARGLRLRSRAVAVQRRHGRLGRRRAVDLRGHSASSRTGARTPSRSASSSGSWSSCRTSARCSARFRR